MRVHARPSRALAGDRSNLEHARTQLRGGGAVILVDHQNASTGGSLVLAASLATANSIAFMIRHTSGFVCVPMTKLDADRLELPLMAGGDDQGQHRGFTVTVDSRDDVSTGISAHDRAHTINLLADPNSTAAQLTRPGHVVPVRTTDAGLLGVAARPEAAVDLVRLAGLPPVAALAELVSDDATPALPAREIHAFSRSHGLPVVSIDELIRFRLRGAHAVTRGASARVPLKEGEFTAICYVASATAEEHVAFVAGDPTAREAVLVYAHQECVVGDIFRSQSCGCAENLAAALDAVARAGVGVVTYIRNGATTSTAVAHPAATVGTAAAFTTNDGDLIPHINPVATTAQILLDLSVRSVRLVAGDTTDPAVLEDLGVNVIDQVPLSDVSSPEAAGASL
jgi:3,4-dihydroxy 2-butanone 4-phosphate synthase / GTP cyclohydrolase II